VDVGVAVGPASAEAASPRTTPSASRLQLNVMN
jgi:hypothetical protein